MKKEYYIQGDPARGEEIKAAFKAKGIDTASFGLNHDEFLYYSSNGLLYFEDFSSALLNVFKTNPGYTELPLSVEHKFKVGDWIVRGEGFVYEPSLITEIRDYYICESQNGERATYTSNDVHKNFHLWTIQDAKDGDVLATDNGWACIFKAFDGWTFSSYCFMDSQNWFCEFGSEVHTPDSKINGNIHPATKEQRDLFFKRMKEAGYTWDKKKKELKKTPVKPQFKVGDWVVGIDDEGDIATEKIVSFSRNKVLLLDTDGCHTEYPKTELNGFHLWTIADAKDGDVLVCYSEAKGSPIEQAGILKQYVGQHGGCSNTFLAHTGIDWDGNVIINGYMGSTNILPATKEQRDLLFAKMKESGYEWDADKKELNKIQTHYDIANFHEGMPVLVRDDNSDEWNYLFFSHYRKKFSDHFFAGGSPWCQCIPFSEDTKHLLGTTDPCDERYVNW